MTEATDCDTFADADVEMFVRVKIGRSYIMLNEVQARETLNGLTKIFHIGEAAIQRLDDTESNLWSQAQMSEEEDQRIWKEMDGRYQAMGEYAEWAKVEIENLERQIAALTNALAPVPASTGSVPQPTDEQDIAHPPPLPRHGEPWTDEERERLRELLHTDKTYAEIAALMDRTAQSVQSKVNGHHDLFAIRNPVQAAEQAAKLPEGVTPATIKAHDHAEKNTRRVWSVDDDERLQKGLRDGLTHEAIGRMIGRTRGSVAERAIKLGLANSKRGSTSTRPSMPVADPDPWDSDAARELRATAPPSTRDGRASERDREVASHLTSSGKPWTDAQDAILASTMNQGGALGQAALLLKRSGGEVRERWRQICLNKNKKEAP